MCLAVISTSHPVYPFVLISNRDEFLNRPTLRADWWEAPNTQVLGGRDLQQPAKGTWLGITKQGRIAILTNFRDEGQQITSDRSRGEIPKIFLTLSPDSSETVEAFAKRLVEDEGVDGVGGFSLIFGQLKAPRNGNNRPLGVVSNRTPDVHGVIWIAQDVGDTIGQTCALSNSHFGDHAWPKVVDGERILKRTIGISAKQKEGLDKLVNRCFEVLSTDTLPRAEAGADWHTTTKSLRNSIFIPPIGGERAQDQSADAIAAGDDHKVIMPNEGVYGTQKQTVIVVDREGSVTFVEKSLYGKGGNPVPEKEQVRRFNFQIEGWNS